MRSTQVFTVLALLATSVSSISVGHSSNQLAPHRRHGADRTHNSVLQARGARRHNPNQEDVSKREETTPRRVRKRGINQRRCAARSSSLPAAASSTSSVAATSATPEPKPTTSAAPEPTTTSYVEPTTTSQAKAKEPATSKTSTKASKTSTAAEASPTADSGSGSGSGTNTGEATFYGTGLGSCGITNVDTDFICAVSQLLFDGFEGYTGGNPNSNPICGRKIKATYQGKSVTVTVTDRCVGCAYNDLDFSPAAFDQLADQSLGRLKGMTWSWV